MFDFETILFGKPEFESKRFREVLDGRVVVVDDDAHAPDVATHSNNLLNQF